MSTDNITTPLTDSPREAAVYMTMSQGIKFVNIADVPAIFATLKRGFRQGHNRTLEQRQKHLRAIVNLINENEEILVDALAKDVCKPRSEALMTEIRLTRSDCIDAIEELPHLMKPREIGFFEKTLANKFDGAALVPNPLGVTLVIGAWNYPFQLAMIPVIGALAGGNTVLLKPSEVSPNTAAAIAQLVPKYFSPDVFAVANGAVAETTAILLQPFDHFFYTGSGTVGRIVMAAAAKHLAKVTLELGGKSPVVIDRGVDLNVAARRILWGRALNAGQTCIAPDYILCHADQQDALAAAFRKCVREFFGEDPKKSPDYGRIVNDHHFKRVVGLMQHGRAVVGGETDAAERYIAPTVLVDVKLDSPLMQDEIFGPLLPIVPIDNIDAAVDFINSRDKPLAAYVFSNNKAVVRRFEEEVPCGGMTVNDVMMHIAAPCLPFGGVGASGCGAYHGKYTFEEFVHLKPVLRKDSGMEWVNNMLRYAPYNEVKTKRLCAVLYPVGEPCGATTKLMFLGTAILAAGCLYARMK
eukprot:PhM_4_TR13941/c0_g1_i1/m.5343/K00128/ALDH; aldehyde dehydrogenase (NAD+)